MNGGKAVLGNNKTSMVKRIGNLRLKLHNDTELVLQDVRSLPKLNKNLVTLVSLDKEGCTFRSENGKLRYQKDLLW